MARSKIRGPGEFLFVWIIVTAMLAMVIAFIGGIAWAFTTVMGAIVAGGFSTIIAAVGMLMVGSFLLTLSA